jgi:hypothetical protein
VAYDDIELGQSEHSDQPEEESHFSNNDSSVRAKKAA